MLVLVDVYATSKMVTSSWTRARVTVFVTSCTLSCGWWARQFFFTLHQYQVKTCDKQHKQNSFLTFRRQARNTMLLLLSKPASSCFSPGWLTISEISVTKTLYIDQQVQQLCRRFDAATSYMYGRYSHRHRRPREGHCSSRPSRFAQNTKSP